MATQYIRYPNPTSSLTTGDLTDAGTDGIVVTGGTGAVVGTGTSIAQHVADSTHNGYLSSADWTTFNNKQASGTYVSTLAAVGAVPNANGASISSNTLTLQPADGTNPGVLSNTTQNIVGAKTFTTQLIGHGTSAIDDAAAGYIGEFITAESAGINGPTSTQFGDVTNITLTAGDWDISVNGEGFLSTATGLTAMGLGIGTASGNSSTGQVAGINFHSVAPATAAYNAPVTIANYRVSISGSTTYYLKSYAVYSGGTPQFRGRISARRVR